ncbi:proprotein convertase subtilisin/kexin type 5-like [Gigantopelta aegis]|uniref:proprotein convertase subtilisin/kexin type 5-like n=1 Tax=Gigantopelta aegis TaxID=1735272 RepID=UPI001B8885D9|nr:proprotein convertase subtilisin/kexin type 5-like [Gigantopelta aegis]
MLLTVLCLLSLRLLNTNGEPCPNPAKHCSSETFNVVFPNVGCLGCQGGCEAGYIMTSNPNVYRETTAPMGHYMYKGLPVPNNKNVSEPQWLCNPGDECHAGFFKSAMMGHPSCEWCGEGCSHCSGFGHCTRCFGGYKTQIHLSHGVATRKCLPGTVFCPNRTEHCTHKIFVLESAGCLGCQDCEDGYMVTFNPLYYSYHGGHYDYKGLTIHDGRNVNQPRHICHQGTTCPDGWYEIHHAPVSICEWCGLGCVRCGGRNDCRECKHGYTLEHSHCLLDSHIVG